METIDVQHGADKIVVQWDGAQASAPILVDGQATQYQTADARHRTEQAVRLACSVAWGPVYDTREAADADGRGPGDQITIWDDVTYETREAEITDEPDRGAGPGGQCGRGRGTVPSGIPDECAALVDGERCNRSQSAHVKDPR